jgi:SAM-dependent methyltransferase/uncharacterized protein YbaR (Trm112 family)
MIPWLHLLCCPHCRADLHQSRQSDLVCRGCARSFPVILGIPDLRVAPDPYIGIEEERAKVEKLAARFGDFDFSGFVDFYYSITSVVPPKHAAQYKRGLMAAVPRAAAWMEEWEENVGGARVAAAPGQPAELLGFKAPQALLEVGCGTGPLLVAARGCPLTVGVDIALRWLVVAKKRLEEAGVNAPLICACAEALPLRDDCFDRVVADSALEHFRDQRAALREARRVMKSGGALCLATPNRYSVGPDPHTGVWCGSFLPDAWTAGMVRRAGGIPPKRRLLSASSLRSLLAEAEFSDLRLQLPRIAPGQRQHFSPVMRLALDGYDLARRLPVSRQLLFAIGPLLLATARKES